jgi:hypothetical protein
VTAIDINRVPYLQTFCSFEDTYGQVVSVAESSAAGGRHFWVRAFDTDGDYSPAHLSEEQVVMLIEGLIAALLSIESEYVAVETMDQPTLFDLEA